jgi:hypothetical protein
MEGVAHAMARQTLFTARARPEEVVGKRSRRSLATATGAFLLAADAKSIKYQLTWDRTETAEGLRIDLHNFAKGAPGKVVAVLCGDSGRPCPAAQGGTIEGTWPIDPKLAHELAAERIYVDIHTAASRDGEVRAQVLPLPWMVHSRQYLVRLGRPNERAANGTGTFYVTPFPQGTRLTFDLTVAGLPDGNVELELRRRGGTAARLRVDRGLVRRGGTVSGILEVGRGGAGKGVAPLSPGLLTTIEAKDVILAVLVDGKVVSSGSLVPVL